MMHPSAKDNDDNNDDNDDAALDGDATIRDALQEYEQVAALCNTQSLLSNAATASWPPPPALPHEVRLLLV